MLEILDRWLLAEVATLDPEIARLSAVLFAEHPALLVTQNLIISKAIDVGVRALADDLGVELDYLLSSVIRESVASLVTAFMAAVLVAGEDVQKAHDTVMRFLRAGINAVTPQRSRSEHDMGRPRPAPADCGTSLGEEGPNQGRQSADQSRHM
jgi:hypothetical protein